VLQSASALAARLSSARHGTILCFHGVQPSGPIPTSSAHVSADHFRATIDVARSVALAVPLRELIERQRTGRSTRGLFAVTFDDAYRSLAGSAVRDALDNGRLPITVFVVNDASERGLAFWWDRVEAIHPLVGYDEWTAFERSIELPDTYRTAAALAYGPLRPLRQWVLQQHAGRWPRAAEESLSALETRAKAPDAPRAMSFLELDAFIASGNVDVGVHTLSHPVLPLLDDDEVRREVGASFDLLRARWPSTLPWLAVPFGLYDARTSRLTRDAGLEGILTLNAFTLRHASQTHGLPRVNITENAPNWKVALRLSGLSDLIWTPPHGHVPFPPGAAAD
jgi:peptidoglycan/xylan/chitin deacetylase (PgdA/CDA1 family)